MEKGKTTILAVAGKGGVGKTSIAATMVRLLCQAHPDKKVLAIDADPAFPFEKLAETVKMCQDVTRAIDHAMTAPMTDCNVCSLKKVCDEVEGIRELHFGKKE